VNEKSGRDYQRGPLKMGSLRWWWERFRTDFCTDNGRAINQQEPGVGKYFDGLAEGIFLFWQQYLKARGYKIRYQMSTFPMACRVMSASR
jgi:hypothetical protein